jgi:hypothetical protein
MTSSFRLSSIQLSGFALVNCSFCGQLLGTHCQRVLTFAEALDDSLQEYRW